MGYLYLNFLDNLEKGSKSWDDFYTTSLTEQYEVLKRKLGGYASGTLQEFISMAFPAQTSKYYNISMPSFDRRMKENRFGKQCIYNIVIRPETDSYLSYILPSNYDFIIIGDVTFGRWIQNHNPSQGLLERQSSQISFEMENFYKKAKKILIDNREFLDKLAQALMNKDVLTGVEIEAIKATCKMVA